MTNWGAPPPPRGQQPYGAAPPPGQQPWGQQPQPFAQPRMPYGQPAPYGYPQTPYGQAVAPAKVSPAVLVGVSVWRLVIVVCAITGFSLALGASGDVSSALPALSQQAGLVTAICYLILLLYPAFTRGRRHEPVTPWLRGALAVLLALVSVTFLTLLGGGLDETWSLFEHLLTPLVVLVDWLAVGRNQRAARWWFPITWLAFPLAYLLFYIAYVGGGEPIYPFLDPSAGDFFGIVLAFLAAVLAFGFLVYGIGKLKGAIADDAVRPVTPQPTWGPPQIR